MSHDGNTIFSLPNLTNNYLSTYLPTYSKSVDVIRETSRFDLIQK